MIPAAFGYTRPGNLAEALRLVGSEDGVKIIAGGQSLLPLLKLRLAAADHLVDVGRIPELQGIREGTDGGIVIGATTTYREVLESPLVAERSPLLLDVIRDIGDVQVRNRGTLGGSIAHADPASDLPAAALALEATFALRSLDGQRAGPADGFFIGPFQTAIGARELLLELRFPPLPAGAGTAYRQLMQPASGYSLVGIAAVVAREGARIGHIRVGVTGVGEVAYRAKAVEAALAGTDGSAEAIATAAASVTDGQQVASDIHADARYRGAMAVVLTRRALEAAIAQAA